MSIFIKEIVGVTGQQVRDRVRNGRRTRNMREKQERILVSATTLFAKHGFAGVTVQEIADTADVAAGTLFRYASSKAELLLMVYNEQFRRAIDLGIDAARQCDEPVSAVYAMVTPIIEAAEDHPGNAMAYQRELLFGDPSERYRAEGLALVGYLQDSIAERLVQTRHSASIETDAVLLWAARAARSVFAVLHLLLARPSTAADWGTDTNNELRQQIAQIVVGFFASLPSVGHPAVEQSHN
ncbi:TetR/AcrR family transcriptional regulator [Mycobacterium malmoense]|nr:TetR/AcrR family transcriptional regulator [Mycobacterium malmoense]